MKELNMLQILEPVHKTDSQNRTFYVPFYPSNFNGKEKDYESGFHYYGARYYWGELLTGWLSVDPMADKYQSISPYAYCAWNPIMIVDPDGKDTLFITNNGTVDHRKKGGRSTFIQVNNTWQEVPMPGRITKRPSYSKQLKRDIYTNTEDPKYSNNDYLIAAATGYFNYERESGSLKLYSDGGKEIPTDETMKIPSLSPSLVKAIAMQESFCGVENVDILQQNNAGDWGDWKELYGLKNGSAPDTWLSLVAGIRILAAKGFKGSFKADGSCSFRGWRHAIVKYNGGGNPNYFRFVNEMYHETTGVGIQ